MDKKKLIASAAVAAVLTLGAGTAVVAQQGGTPVQGDGSAINGTALVENEAGEDRDSDESLKGSSAQKAADAALRAVEGAVIEVEQGDDPGAAYEVEVRKPDGGIAELHLDDNFKVIGQESGD